MPAVIQPGEVSRRGGGKHLGDGFFILRRDVPAVEEIPAHVLPVALAGLFRPLVVLAGVVHHEVRAQVDPLLVAGGGQLLQVVHGAQVGADGAEVGRGVAAVAALGHGVQEEHQVEHVHPGPLNVGQFFPHPVQVPGEVVDVQHHAGEVVGSVPLRVGLPLQVPLFQGSGALLSEAVELAAQLGKHGVVAVQLHVQPAQLVQMPGQAGLEQPLFFLRHFITPLF